MKTPPFRHSRLQVLVAALFALTVTCLAASARADDVWTDPFPGMRHLHRTTSDQNIHVLHIDLCAAGISFRATTWDERGQTTSGFGSSVGAQAAVNGDFFVSGFELERGIAVGNGMAWPPSIPPEDESVGQVAFGDERVELIPDSVLQAVEPWMQEVVGGRPTVLLDGNGTNTSGHPDLCLRNPRTVVGLSEDKRTLFVAVVDGRAAPTRLGMTCDELGVLMKDLGAHNALNLDGGGSSTIWLEGEGVLNYPTDGSERTVGTHLAILATGEGKASACAAAHGELEAATCEGGIAGWVKNAAAPVEIDLTFDAMPGTANANVHTAIATMMRPDICNAAGVCGLGFSLAIPDELQDGRDHSVWASFKGQASNVLAGSPTPFRCGDAPASDAGKPGPSETDGGSDQEPSRMDAGGLAQQPSMNLPSETRSKDSGGCRAVPGRSSHFVLVSVASLLLLMLPRMKRRRRR